jgi:hypothetical protein
MEINRNQYFMIGIVVLLIGLQLRAVSSYVLNEKATQFLAERAAKPTAAINDDSSFFASSPPVTAATSVVRKKIELPEWSGWCLLSIGAVLILHSLAMKRPD